MSYFIYKFLHEGDTLKELEGSPPLKKLKQLDLKQMKQGKVDNKIPQTVHRTLTILKATSSGNSYNGDFIFQGDFHLNLLMLNQRQD